MVMVMLFAMVAMIYLFLFLQQAETGPTHDTPASHVSLSTLIILIIQMRMAVVMMTILMTVIKLVFTLKK